jgi:hypothetical protein
VVYTGLKTSLFVLFVIVLSCGLSTQVSYTSEYKYKEIVIFREESQRYKQENLLEQEKKITLGVHMVFERWRSFRTLQGVFHYIVNVYFTFLYDRLAINYIRK